MTKLLNVDALNLSEKAIMIGGVEHTVVEQSVGSVIKALEMEERMKKMTRSQQISNMVQLIQTAIPSTERSDILELPITTMYAILDFINSPAETAEVDEEGKSALPAE